MKEEEMSATQKAAVEKIRIMMKEHALVMRSSFLYTREELLRNMEKDLSKMDEEYIEKHGIPGDVVKKLAREVYDILMEKGEYDRAIALSDHYKL